MDFKKSNLIEDEDIMDLRGNCFLGYQHVDSVKFNSWGSSVGGRSVLLQSLLEVFWSIFREQN